MKYICQGENTMKKFAVIFGRRISEIQKRAIEELSKTLLEYTFEYPVCCEYKEGTDMGEYIKIYVGTKESNPYIKDNSQKELTKQEEYFIKVENDIIIVEGYDDAGVLYGAIDFYNKYILMHERPDIYKCWLNVSKTDALPSFEYSSSPSVKERGLWTWGHVIYDYRGYIDNMMKLKMNSVIIWNDFAPVNAREIVDYAHSRNIRVIWGFSWLWDTNCKSVDIKNLGGYAETIFEKYEAGYSDLAVDGIYFQTFTELKEDNIDGVLVAKAAAEFVNETAVRFYEKYPELEIQFGLHATSVKNKLEFIKAVDSRIRIVWEDCGAFPFSYDSNDVSNFEETKAFAAKLARLRGANDKFGVVTKGLVKLDWSQFKYADGSYCIGVSSEHMKQNRIERKRKIWKYIQSGWLRHSDKAREMVRGMCLLKGGDLNVYALVEDGMFEENIMYPVALYSEMLWDCERDLDQMIQEVANRSYVTFA